MPRLCWYNELSRLEFLARTAASAAVLAAPAWLPQVAYAQTEDTSRDIIVSIFLRGGADGLSLVVPYAENGTTRCARRCVPRPDSTSANKAIDLNGFFGLPPAMASLLPAYQAGNLWSSTPRVDRSDAIALRRAGLHGNRRARLAGYRHGLARPPSREQGADETGLGPARARLQLRIAADARRRSQHAAHPESGELRVERLVHRQLTRLAWLGTSFADELDPLKASALNTQRTITQLAAIGINGYVPAGGAVYPTSSFGTALRSTAALIRADVGVEAIQMTSAAGTRTTRRGR